MKNQVRKQFLKDIREHARDFIKKLHAKNKFKRVAYKRLKGEIIRYLQKKQQDKIDNELKKLRLAKLANNNISKSYLVNIKRFNALPIKDLRQIAKLRNINTSLSKSNIIYAFILSEPIINEEKYIFDNVNEVHSKINDVRLQLLNVSPYIIKKKRDNIRKRLYEIENTRNIDRKLKNR